MSLKPGQNRMYFALWGQYKKLHPEADRKALHVQWGLPESHTAWNSGDLDDWKARILAEVDPGNLQAQLDAPARVPRSGREESAGSMLSAKRLRYGIRATLAALGKPEAYAEAIAKSMTSQAEVALDHLGEKVLRQVRIALDRNLHRQWPDQAALCAAVFRFWAENNLDGAAVEKAVAKAIYPAEIRAFEAMSYDQLTKVMTALRPLATSSEAPAA